MSWPDHSSSRATEWRVSLNKAATISVSCCYNPFVHSSFTTESIRFAKSTPGIRMKSESSRKRDYSAAYGATDHFSEAQGGKYQTLA